MNVVDTYTNAVVHGGVTVAQADAVCVLLNADEGAERFVVVPKVSSAGPGRVADPASGPVDKAVGAHRTLRRVGSVGASRGETRAIGPVPDCLIR